MEKRGAEDVRNMNRGERTEKNGERWKVRGGGAERRGRTRRLT